MVSATITVTLRARVLRFDFDGLSGDSLLFAQCWALAQFVAIAQPAHVWCRQVQPSWMPLTLLCAVLLLR